MWPLLRCCTFLTIFVGITNADPTHLRRLHVRGSDSNSPIRNLQESNNDNKDGTNDTAISYFRITVVGTIIEADANGRFRLSDEIENISCIPIIDGTESNDMYSINLPDHFISTHATLISVGKLYVGITHTRILEKEERVVVTKNSTISVMGDTRAESKGRNGGNNNEYSNTIGRKTLAVVRISTRDATPTHDALTMRKTLFNTNAVNLRTQYMNCSFGQLEWLPAPAGIVEVYVDQPISDFTTGSSLVTAAQTVMVDSMGIEPSSLGDKVMMCLPPGTGGWIASSGVNHWRSQFNDEWCLSLTATMHEIGHMIGLIHSNEDGVAYGDSTDYMAAGHRETDWPRKCFNGYKNWQLGWYQNRQLTVDSSALLEKGQLLKLTSFVDFSRTDIDEYVLIVVASELYLAFNLAMDFNIDTEEKRNQVTVTAAGENGSESLAGLKEKESYRQLNFQNSNRELVIEVCTRDRGKLGSYLMWISIAYDESMCDKVQYDTVVKGYKFEVDISESPTVPPTRQPITQPPTSSPTLSPTQWPSDYPSEMPSDIPSGSPTNTPTTAEPTITPSRDPTRRPTNVPSKHPTSSPTFSPAPSTGSVDIFPDTPAPSPQPKIDYQKLLKKRESKIQSSVTVKLDEWASLFSGGGKR